MTFVDPTEATRSGIEEVITSTIGNRVTAKNRPRVRIPPTPPKPRTFYVRGFPFFDTDYLKGHRDGTERCPWWKQSFLGCFHRFVLWPRDQPGAGPDPENRSLYFCVQNAQKRENMVKI